MTTINNKYTHNEIEQQILNKLDLTKVYKSNPSSNKPPFVTMMPPPNITGSLHMGHALVLTLQDILVRFHRMQGYDVLWQAGIDHAGIATQLVVERNLLKNNIKRYDLGRENFIKEVYKWKEEAKSNIIEQIQKIGASCDFSNIAFTMDPNFVKAVTKIFVKLHEQGLIYQDYRLVNWDTKLETAVSDLEVVAKEEKGKFYYIKYPLKNGNHILIATTRPETLLGDTGIAVNPKDPRYTKLIGSLAVVPIVAREISIIADDYSDMEKGSGAVKITPAHDFNDFEVGKRHNLPLINILNKNGTLNENVPTEYQGLTITQARTKIVTELENLGLLEKIEDHIMATPYGDRSNTVIEPFLSKQWFLDTTKMAEKSIEVVKHKQVELVPENWENLYFEWLNNIKPWCISRQLWWGHQIPVWYALDETSDIYFVAETEDEALLKAEKHFGKKVILTRDNDVLDTWFSSSLWPFVTLGWNGESDNNNLLLEKYYPNSTLVTGFDILFFWVARMIMMGTHFMQDVPFKQVYLHALVLDEKGQKMSKTKGNVVNPLELMEKYGTDALRFSLATYSGHGRNIKFSEKHLEGSRNFVTKIWNAYRFLEYNNCVYDSNFKPNNIKNSINKWIVYKLSILNTEYKNSITNYKFNDASSSIYQFIWHNFCDWYIEMIKPIFSSEDQEVIIETRNVAMYIFANILKLLHPIMPFVTEYLYSVITNKQSYDLYNEQLEDISFNNFEMEAKDIDFIMNIINKIRSVRAFLGVSPATLVNGYINSNNQKIMENASLIKKLARLESLNNIDDFSKLNLFQEVINSDCVIGLDLIKVIDIKQEIDRLTKEQLNLKNDLKVIESKLNNQGFVNNAKPEVVEQHKELQHDINSKLLVMQQVLAQLENSL
ncbi:valine--tRNA ligase [Rickettsiales bacterium LUAb2]